MEPSQRFAALVATSGEHLPLDEAAVLIAACAEPDLRSGAVMAQLDVLAETCPGYTLDALVPHLFGRGGFGPDRTDYYDPRNSLINHVLERRLGIPITLSVVALEVGRRIGVPMAGVGMPGHFLLQDKVDRSVFIDPFHGGRLLDAEGCQRLFHQLRGPESSVVGRLPGAGGEPVDRGPDAQQPAGDLRPAPRLRRAPLGAGAPRAPSRRPTATTPASSPAPWPP